MQTEKIDRSIKKKSNILILADYSEGNRAAIHFAMRYLYRPGSLIYVIQTWEKPNFGSSMVRDLSPMLESIAKSELEGLKMHLQERYSMPDDQICLIAYEGNLSAFFKTEQYQSMEWQVVLGSRNYESLFTSKDRMTELVDQVSQDLFVLSGFENDYAISEIFILADTPTMASPNLSLLKKIAISENPNVNVCLSRSYGSPEDKELRQQAIIDSCKGARLTFSQVDHSVGQKELKAFSRGGKSKLIILERNPKRRLQSGLNACLDSWLLKSKGIRI